VNPNTAYDSDRDNCGQCGRECADADDANACTSGFPFYIPRNCNCNDGACN
jgi:hypothetical protein